MNLYINFAIVFILHEQHRFTRRHMAPMDARHLGVPTSRPSNNVVCLLKFTSYHHDVKRGDLAPWLFQNHVTIDIIQNI